MNADMPVGPEPPPRGAHAMAIVRWVLLAAMATLAVFAWVTLARSDTTSATAPAKKTKYRCPMHPQIVSDEPGECPRNLSHDARALRRGARRRREAHGEDPRRHDAHPALPRPGAIHRRPHRGRHRARYLTARVTAMVDSPEQGASEVHVRTPGFVERILVAQTGVAVSRGSRSSSCTPRGFSRRSKSCSRAAAGGATGGTRPRRRAARSWSSSGCPRGTSTRSSARASPSAESR